MNGGCPKCGVAVVPGYVRCPRCHAVLPGSGRFRRNSVDPGGTALEERSFPVVPVAIGAVAIALVAILVLGGGGDGGGGGDDGDRAAAPGEAAPGEAIPAPPPNAAPAPAPAPPPPPAPAGPDPRAAAAALERALGRQRLWSRVEASGARVDVRSGACADPGMAPAIEAERAALRGAGLTRLRCLAQSGAVVFERDL